MSSFSDKLAMFQNNSNKINVGNKNNEGINKNKVNENHHILKLDEKVKPKEKEENKEIKTITNSKRKNNIPINDIILNTDDKKQIEKNNFDNNMKKKLSVFENKMKNNNGKSNNINKGAIKENMVSKNNSNQKVINSTNNQKQIIQQLEKKDMENKTDNKNKINNSNNLKNRLNIFESKIKKEEIKDNTEKENKEIKEKNIKINTENKNIEGKNNMQKINSIEIMDKTYKSNNKALNKINIEDNKFDIKSMINNFNNSSNKQKNQNDLILRRSEVINHKPKENKENYNKKSEYNKDKDITEQITYINNKNIMKNNDIDNNNKNSSTKIEKKNDNSKNNDYYNINKTRTEPNISLRTTSEILTPSSLLNSHKENDFSIDLINTKEIFLSKEIHPESEINETFTMAFFISTFNFKQPKVIEKSEELAADCGHSFCSSLPAIVPEIFARYPEKDTKDFEISDLGASICFPNGIKICFEKNEMHVNGLKNYSSILTNQVGKRYFICTYHLYFKYSYEEFMKEYEYGNSIDKTLLQAIRVKSIYIPFCICLLSKYPFFNQMEKCLESLRFTIANHRINQSEIYKLLVYLTKSVPIPPVGTRLHFPLPYYPDFISINQPKYKDIILFGDNPSIILEYLSVEEIIIILRLLLFEQKVLLVGNNYDIISQIAFNFSVLLYPMQWVHTFIPIMTQKMMKYLDSFLPFFNGMHISLYELASGIFENIKENIFIFDFNKHNFEMNTFPNLNSKNIIKKINELIPQFPKNTLNNLTFGLGVVKAYLDKSKNSNKKNNVNNNTEENLGINIKIKQVFIQAFIEVLYDYKSYLSLINEKPIFNTKAMLEKKPKGDYKFYKELTETQLFQVFIQNNPVNKKANTFFEEQLEIYENLKEKKEFKEEFINNYNITCEINEDYFIAPEILENFDIKGNKKIKIQENLKGDEYKKVLRKKYLKYDTYFKQKSILKFNKLIINDKLDFDNNKIDKNIIYYIIPNTKFNFEKEKRRKTIKRKSLLINKLGEELTPEVKDEIRENISDVITKIFKNDEISDPDESLKSVLDSLNSDYGINLYINSLYKNKGILYKESFEFLDELIFSSINKIINNSKISKEKKMFYFLRLIKCCDNFTKDGKSLTEILYPKLDKIQMLNDFNFWKEYAKLYIEDNCSKNMTNDDKWIECLNKIEKIMPMMGLKKTMIYSTLADIGKNNIEESKFSDLMKEVVSRLKIYEV